MASYMNGSTQELMTFSQETDGVKVSVLPVYLDEQSDPDEHNFVWAYQVTIENHSTDTIQLVNRYWNITDAYGRVQEVRGVGVVGEQPVLKPGEVFQYTSGTGLKTHSGIMFGSYEMVNHNQKTPFIIRIPAFSLDIPEAREKLN